MKPILATIILLLLCSQVFAQQNTDSMPDVMFGFRSFTDPVYPLVARVAKIEGDVSLKVVVRADGSIESVTALSGDPTLIQAAMESVRQSAFQCRGCQGLTEKSLIYSFRISPAEAGPCCCTSGHPDSEVPRTQTKVLTETGHITIIAPPICVCPDSCTEAAAKASAKFRSAKCLYLWKCGTHPILLQ